MPDGEKTLTVLVAVHQDILRKIKDALADTQVALLHASTKQEAIAILNRLKLQVDVAIVELELADFDGWNLIRELTVLPNKPLKLIATTSTFSEPFFKKIKAIGVDAVVPRATPPERWRKAIEAVLVSRKVVM